MKILVLGKGAREHAIIYKIQESIGVELYAWPGNPLIEKMTSPFPKSDTLLQALQYAKEIGIDLIICGPETYIVQNASQLSRELGIDFFGPSLRAAQLESSKLFAKKIMEEAKIPTADYKIATSLEDCRIYAYEIFRENKSVVLKASGLAGGKGVFVCHSEKEVEAALLRLGSKEFSSAAQTILVEERLEGKEFSAFAFIGAGNQMIQFMGFAVDFKRLRDNHQGPNTGGMGCYTPVSWLPYDAKKIICQEMIEPTLSILSQKGIDYIGWLYLGLMWTKKGPFLLEYNVRLGDPEAQVLCVQDDSDWLRSILMSLGHKSQKQKAVSTRVKKKACVCVNLVSKDYPFSEIKSKSYPLNEELFSNRDSATLLFGAALERYNDKIMTLSGRVLSVVARANQMEEARGIVYKKIKEIEKIWPNCFYRLDIAKGIK